MGSFIDLTGQRFGRLLVLERNGHRRSFVAWRCLCDCGKEHTVSGLKLYTRRSKSCGCLRDEGPPEHIRKAASERAIKPGTARKAALNTYKSGAKSRGLVWELSDNDFTRLTSGDCHWCGRPPSNTYKSKRSEFRYSGIDRVDNLKGYTVENTVPCCRMCNQMKLHYSVQEFLNAVKRIFSRHLENSIV